MPFIKTKNIHVTPNRSLRYICDPKKTQGGLNIVSANCMPDARNAYLDMKQIYEYYAGRKFNEPMPKSGKAKVKLIHYIQAFDPKDNVGIETAQKIGLDLVKEMFGENVQAVIATHDDTGKVHNHIMLNVYDLKGMHFSSDKATLNKIKKLSDEICKRYGVEPFDREKYVRQSVIFAEQFQAVGIKIMKAAGAYKGTSTFGNISERYLHIYQIITQEKIGSIDALQRKLASAEKKYSELSRRVRELKEKDKGTDDLSEQLASLNEQLSAASKEVRKYKALSDIYDKMTTKEDYISRLVREAKDRTTSEEWCNMIAEQRSIILSELENNINSPMTVIEKKLREKLLKLRTMNVEPHETEQVIRALAIIRIDNITDIDSVHKLSGRMKASAESVKDISMRASFLNRSRDYDDLIEAVRNIDIYPSEQKKTPPKKKHRR
ncbi:MAG: relaxase/mobilization nuclease domain-containing protein [Clostridia bacterium]|nr:relaxase/mobilization nuclease domain-containing protein [Clostridia bacterium]